MSSSIRQVRIDSWKGYQAIALVRFSPDELAGRLGPEFERGHDDLDETLHAGIEAGSGRRFALLRHVGSPVEGTEILWDVRRDDLAEALVEALDTLGISPSEVEWVPRSRPTGFLNGDSSDDGDAMNRPNRGSRFSRTT